MIPFKWTGLVCLFLFLASSGYSMTVSEQNYLKLLVKNAQEKKLSESRYWRILLHYKKGMFGSWESETDAKSFFNAKDGKINPAAELEATLRAFFSPVVTGEESYNHPQCRYIARFSWLDQQLKFDREQMPQQTCKKFQDWVTDLNPESLSMIFPSYYLETAASMFGHTLLRVNSKDNSYTSILNYAINYAANIDPARENAIAFAVLGTFGGYPGVFSIVPYYSKIQEYNDIEQRDIWEYHLNFSRDEIVRMLKHVWELKFAYFDYYFFRENCSYHLLALLEAARPSLNLQEGFWLWTIPGDTIRKLIDIPGLVKERVYRPSRYSMIRQKLHQMNEDEQHLLFQLVEDHTVLDSEQWQLLGIPTQALILEAANDYYVMQGTPAAKKQRFPLLKQRARLKYVLPDRKNKVFSSPPETGHKVSNVGFAGGSTSDNRKFIDVHFKPSFHDLLAYDEGYFPNSEIEFFKFKFRQYENENALLEEMTILSIGSFVPRNRVISPLSWNIKGGFVQEKKMECTNCPVFSLKGGAGASYSVKESLVYSMLEGQYNHHEVYKDNYQAGAGIRLGLLSDFSSKWKCHASAAAFNMVSGHTEMYAQYQIHLRYRTTVNSDIRLEWDKIKDVSETKLGFNIYF